MKICFALLISIFACSSAAIAQACESYYPVNKGTQWELTSYTEKGKVTGKTQYLVLDQQNVDGWVVASLQTTNLDDKGKEIGKSTFEVKCKGDEFFIEMKNFMPQQEEMFQGMTVKAEASYLLYPSGMATGSSLPDGHCSFEIYAESTLFATMKLDIVDRQVLAKENLTTPAGTFDCYKMSSKTTTRTETFGIGIPFEVYSKEWLSKGVGVVRVESYNKNQKMLGYSELTMFKN